MSQQEVVVSDSEYMLSFECTEAEFRERYGVDGQLDCDEVEE
jgi:hypothetical protein